MSRRIAEWIAAYDSQGIHRTGTEGDRTSATWMARIAGDLGLSAALEPLPFQRLEVRAAFRSLVREVAAG